MLVAPNAPHSLGVVCFTEHPSRVSFPSLPLRAPSSRSLSQCEASSNEGNSDNYHSTLKALQSKNRFPKKWLGQHYMVNQQINQKLVQIAQIEEGDLVLEVGPGTGALTSCLVDAGAYVLAVEKDAVMAELSSERFQGSNRVEVVHEDFLKWPLKCSMDKKMELLHTKGFHVKHAKVVSNLPFNITTDVIKRILPRGDFFSSMILLIQDETASRLIDASPKMNEYRPVSLFVHFFSDPEYKLKVERSNFFPRPHVDGAIALFKIKQATEYPSVPSVKSFFTVVNSAFGGRRKMLRNSLQHLYASADVQKALKTVGLLETARPEELSLNQFVDFHNALEKQHGDACTQKL